MAATDLRNILLEGETIIWSGRPVTGLALTPDDWVKIPLSLLLVVIGVYIFRQDQIKWPDPFLEKLVRLICGLAGLYLLAGRFFFDDWIRRGIRYAATNQRILISQTRPFNKFTAINLNRLSEMSLTETTDGRGTIFFGTRSLFWSGQTQQREDDTVTMLAR
jgi:hypothetical protein